MCRASDTISYSDDLTEFEAYGKDRHKKKPTNVEKAKEYNDILQAMYIRLEAFKRESKRAKK